MLSKLLGRDRSENHDASEVAKGSTGVVSGNLVNEKVPQIPPSTDKSPKQELREKCIELLRSGRIEEFNSLRPAGELDLSYCDLAHKDLTGADLRNVNLSYSKLKGANLSEAKVQRAVLDRTDLSSSTLNNAKFYLASLKHTNLCDVKSAKGAQFHNAQLHSAELDRGNFREAQFTGAQLLAVSMVDSKFQNADLQQALLVGAMLTNADFNRANLREARIFQANGADVKFESANLTDAEAIRTYFTNSNTNPKQGTVLKTSFNGAWIKGFRHDEYITEEMLFGGLTESYPPEGTFQKPVEPVDEKILVHGIPGSDKIRFDKAMKQLDEMIGLTQVKDWARSLVNFLIVKLARSQENLPDLEQTLHQLYLGSPGTGKTTVARIVSELLGSLGCLKKGHLVETDKAGMIAGYAGQTMGKTDELINSAIDGTLIVDEFYALFQDEHDSYAKDAVAKLLKRMEDDRDKFCLVGAGYTKETLKTLEANSGFRSRFSHIVTFPDYSTGELIDILKLMMRKKEFIYTQEFLAYASVVLSACKVVEGDKFGNGRTVRNLFEKTYKGPMANRLVTEDKLKNRAALRTPLIQDIPYEDMTNFGRSIFPPIEEIKWVDPKTKQAIGYKELPLDGPFPCLTEESVKLIKHIVTAAILERKSHMAA